MVYSSAVCTELTETNESRSHFLVLFKIAVRSGLCIQFVITVGNSQQLVQFPLDKTFLFGTETPYLEFSCLRISSYF
jgi:hypothetical protein